VEFRLEEDAFFDGTKVIYLDGRQSSFHLISDKGRASASSGWSPQSRPDRLGGAGERTFRRNSESLRNPDSTIGAVETERR
jgi:hypothetical protein